MGVAAADDPMVSVIVPTYGRDLTYFREAVASVADQTYGNIELVVVDDSSETVSEGVRSDAFVAVRRLTGGDRDGAASARNAGIEAASGSLVAFLDDDDLWHPTKVEKQVRTLERGDCGVVYTGLTRTRDGQKVSVGHPDTTGEVTRSILRGKAIAPFSAVMVETARIEAAGTLDERLPYLEDREWYLRLSRTCRFCAIREPLVTYRLGDHAQATDNYEGLRDVAYPLFVEKHRSLARSFGWRCERQFVAALTRSVALAALSDGRYDEARRFVLRALLTWPLSLDGYKYLLAAIGGRFTYLPLQQLNRTVNRAKDRIRRAVEST